MRFSVPLLLLCLLLSNATLAQDIRYVSGDQTVALRDGPGDDYQIIHRGIPPGSRLTVSRTSDDGLWADITTHNDYTGWIPAQKLLVEAPESIEPNIQQEPPEQPAENASGELVDEEAPLAEIPVEFAEQLRIRDEQFNAVAQELYRLKRVSARAEQLDIDNRRLVDKTENLRSEVEMLQAENLRLQDKVESEDFMNGALAVLLGVIIALVAPRLVPKRRKSSSWA